jgi:vanillate O-demethylase monooxygenase subunit
LPTAIPFLRNAWYVAARADELAAGALLGRRLLDDPVVLYRRADGSPVALTDRCPHRFAPLHLGRIVGDNVQCGYHGLQFDCTGKCVVAPFGDKIPAAAQVRSYPVVERHAMLWIWMGDADKADAADIPDFSCMTDPKRAQLHGYQKVAANYELIVDNLADLSHAPFLHGSFVDAAVSNKMQFELLEKDRTVTSIFLYPSVPPTPQWKGFAGRQLPTIDRWSEMRWDPPCASLLYGGVTPAWRARSEGLDFYGVHLLSPETAKSTHYWYCHCRGFRIDEPEVDAMVREWQRVAFQEQDKPMLQEQQRALGDVTDIMAMKPVLLSADAGAVRIRRRLKALITAEQQQVTT